MKFQEYPQQRTIILTNRVPTAQFPVITRREDHVQARDVDSFPLSESAFIFNISLCSSRKPLSITSDPSSRTLSISCTSQSAQISWTPSSAGDCDFEVLPWGSGNVRWSQLHHMQNKRATMLNYSGVSGSVPCQCHCPSLSY